MTKAVHTNVKCRECVSTINGWRHSCLHCTEEYDLCEICFRYTSHNEDHVFMTLKKPCEVSLTQTKKPFFIETPYAKKQPIKPLTLQNGFVSTGSPFTFQSDAFTPKKQDSYTSGLSPPSRFGFTLEDTRVSPFTPFGTNNNAFSSFYTFDSTISTTGGTGKAPSLFKQSLTSGHSTEIGMDVQ